MRRVSLVAAAVALGLPSVASAATPGAAGIGDPYYPNAGNGGYDVAHYGLDLSYQPDRIGILAATTEAGVGTNTYSYDPQYRLTGDTRGTTSTRGWGYDGATQILTTSISLPPSSCRLARSCSGGRLTLRHQP